MARVLVLNSGSSSLKYQLLDMDGPARLASGQVERIGHDDAIVTHGRADGGDWREDRDTAVVEGHGDALRAVVDALRAAGLDADIAAVGHRVVHGGERFVDPTPVDDDVLAGIRALAPLAPLHNPANADGIAVARDIWPDVPQVAVFDTAFHATLPARAHRYAVPDEWRREHDVRRYGFHGTSHGYVARRAEEILGNEGLRVVTAHLGNGASVTAVAGGRSVDTSMGLSPLEGLVMGTRSGDLDPTVIFHIARETGLDLDDLERALNRDSGLVALCGDNDLRSIEERAAARDDDARLALEVFCYRIRKYVGAYAAALGGLDALVFTAGIGEHSPTVRRRVCEPLDFLGITLDPDANERSDERIDSDGGQVAVLVVPTDEEHEIARQSLAVVKDPSTTR